MRRWPDVAGGDGSVGRRDDRFNESNRYFGFARHAVQSVFLRCSDNDRYVARRIARFECVARPAGAKLEGACRCQDGRSSPYHWDERNAFRV